MNEIAISAHNRLVTPRARVGVIIPTSNRMIEPQFMHYAPPQLGIHFARAQITGRWAKPLGELRPEIARAARTLADVKPDLMVFNCTATAMREGASGEAELLDVVRKETGVDAVATASAVVEALDALAIRKLVLITPYIQATNDHEIGYLHSQGLKVVHDVALGLVGGDQFITVAPERWIDIALTNDRPDADGYFLSCTNTTQIEAVDEIELRTGKPVVTSNQAVLWASINRLRSALTLTGPAPLPGRLARLDRAVRSAAE